MLRIALDDNFLLATKYGIFTYHIVLNLPTTKLIAHFFLAAFRLKTILLPSNFTGLIVAGLMKIFENIK